MKIGLPLLLLILASITAHAAELSNKSLSGTWKFTHMILDGERTVLVNRDMKFLPSGEIVNYDRKGEENGRANYVIDGDFIRYSDKRGAQPWKVIKFDSDTLIVDHKGAEMFFTKP